MIFKMQLSEDQKLGNRARREFLEKNKIHIKAVRDQRTAIVSMEEALTADGADVPVGSELLAHDLLVLPGVEAAADRPS